MTEQTEASELAQLRFTSSCHALSHLALPLQDCCIFIEQLRDCNPPWPPHAWPLPHHAGPAPDRRRNEWNQKKPPVFLQSCSAKELRGPSDLCSCGVAAKPKVRSPLLKRILVIRRCSYSESAETERLLDDEEIQSQKDEWGNLTDTFALTADCRCTGSSALILAVTSRDFTCQVLQLFKCSCSKSETWWQ